MQDTGITFTMLWDPTFDSWRQLGISSQPAGMLLNRYGQILGQWRGAIPEDDVLETIGA